MMEVKAALAIFVMAIFCGVFVNCLFVKKERKGKTKEEVRQFHTDSASYSRALLSSLISLPIILLFWLVDRILTGPQSMPLAVWLLLLLGWGIGISFSGWLLWRRFARELGGD